jgi:hypothetical protein
MDTPPLLDVSALITKHEGNKTSTLRDVDLNRLELASLLQVLWVLSISHVVIVVADRCVDVEVRFFSIPDYLGQQIFLYNHHYALINPFSLPSYLTPSPFLLFLLCIFSYSDCSIQPKCFSNP